MNQKQIKSRILWNDKFKYLFLFVLIISLKSSYSQEVFVFKNVESTRDSIEVRVFNSKKDSLEIILYSPNYNESKIISAFFYSFLIPKNRGENTELLVMIHDLESGERQYEKFNIHNTKWYNSPFWSIIVGPLFGVLVAVIVFIINNIIQYYIEKSRNQRLIKLLFNQYIDEVNSQYSTSKDVFFPNHLNSLAYSSNLSKDCMEKFGNKFSKLNRLLIDFKNEAKDLKSFKSELVSLKY